MHPSIIATAKSLFVKALNNWLAKRLQDLQLVYIETARCFVDLPKESVFENRSYLSTYKVKKKIKKKKMDYSLYQISFLHIFFMNGFGCIKHPPPKKLII